MRESYVLDACALVALLKKEEGSNIVADIYRKTIEGDVKLYINRITLMEVYYGFYRNNGGDYARNIVDNVEFSPIIISDVDTNLLLEAGRLKAIYRISMADSVVLAQAFVLDGYVLTSDHSKFDAIEGYEKIKFDWIR